MTSDMWGGQRAHIRLRNESSIVEADVAIRVALEARLTLKVKEAKFMPAVQSGRWDGSIRFLKQNGTFPTGLFCYITSLLRYFNVPFTVTDERVVPEHAFDLTTSTILRSDDQVPIVDAAQRAQRGIIEDPTGCGKTCCFTELIARLGVPTTVLVFNRTLAYQTRRRLAAEYGVDEEDIGFLGDSVWDPRFDFLNVALFQTLFVRHTADKKNPSEVQRMKEAQAFCATQQCLIVDEVHHLFKTLSKFKRVIPMFENAYYRFGFSALPFNDKRASEAAYFDPDACTMIGIFGPPVATRTLKQAVEQGVLVEPMVLFVDYPKDEVVVADDWALEVEANIVRNQRRNEAIAEVCQELVKNGYTHILLMLERLEHVAAVCDTLAGLDLTFDTCVGPDSEKKRQATLAAFTQGEVPILVTNRVLREGIDVPQIRAVILGTGMSAAQLVLQTIGRGVRKSDGKSWVPVFDFNDKSALLKFMDKHWRSRVKFYTGEGIATFYGTSANVTTFLAGGDLPTKVSRKRSLPPPGSPALPRP